MKITDVRVHAGQLEGAGTVTMVQVVGEGGMDGWGDFRLPGKIATVAACLREFVPWLVGQDAFRTEHIWQDLFRGSFWRGGPVILTALSAIDTALWDLKAKSLGVPLFQLLGGLARQKVRVYRHAEAPTSDEHKRRIDALLAEGYTALRVGFRDRGAGREGAPGVPGGRGAVFEPQRAVEAAVGEFAAMREHCGSQVDLCIDVHTRLNPALAVELCDALVPFRPFFVEDPLRSENPQAFRLLRSKTKARLATGEQLCGKWAFRELIAENLVDYLRVDLCHVGGVTETRKIANWAEAYYVETALHCTSGRVGDLASMHVDLSIPNCGIQEFGGPGGATAGIVTGGYTVEGGYLVPTGEPGLGARVDVAALERLAPLPASVMPRLRREDGAVTDW